MDEADKCSILIVDDEPVCIKYLVTVLYADYSLIVAKSGESAIELAQKYIPNLILMDVNMPVMDGYEVLSLLKADDATKAIPIIFITGRDNSEDKEKAFKLGAVDFIQKNSGIDTIRAAVEKQLHC